MKQPTKYLHLIALSMTSGMAYPSVYEIENFDALMIGNYPKIDLNQVKRGDVNHNWTKPGVRLSEAFNRFVRQPLWRKAPKAGSAA